MAGRADNDTRSCKTEAPTFMGWQSVIGGSESYEIVLNMDSSRGFFEVYSRRKINVGLRH